MRDHLDVELPFHFLDHIFNREPAQFAAIQSIIIDNRGQRGAALDGLLHRIDAVKHLLVDGGLDHVFRHLLRNHLHHRLRNITVGPQINAHHARHDREQERSENPALMAAYDVDVILDIQLSPGHVIDFVWLHPFTPLAVLRNDDHCPDRLELSILLELLPDQPFSL